MARVGVYAGTFDPPTKGHFHVIRQAAPLFDTLYVATGVNPGKKPMFTVEERTEMLESIIQSEGLGNVVVGSYSGLLVHYARSINASFIVRGIRSSKDFDYEADVKMLNGRVDPKIETIYLIPPRELTDVSSSAVKGFVGFDGWENVVADFVHPIVLERLEAKARLLTEAV